MREKVTDITYEEISKVLNYDPETGIITWLIDTNNSKSGDIAGSDSGRGYLRVGYKYKLHKNHRIAWLLYYKEWPSGYVDHINGVKTDNRISNLRIASIHENNRNKKISSRNKSGFTGVYYNKKNGKWRTSIGINGKEYGLGCYEDLELAGFVATEAREKYYGKYFSSNKNSSLSKK